MWVWGGAATFLLGSGGGYGGIEVLRDGKPFPTAPWGRNDWRLQARLNSARGPPEVVWLKIVEPCEVCHDSRMVLTHIRWNLSNASKVVICPQAGRAFTLCLQLQWVNRALGSAARRSQKIIFTWRSQESRHCGAAIRAKHPKKICGNLSNRWRKPVCMAAHSTPSVLCNDWDPATTGSTGGYSHWSPSDLVHH